METQSVLVSTIRPDGYHHVRAFDEVTEVVATGLSRLGFNVQRVDNSVSTDIPTIMFGGHLLGEDSLIQLPANTILYNLEQVDSQAPWIASPYARSMRTHEVWDFSETNVRRLHVLEFAKKLLWAPIGYVPELSRIPQAEEDIDILFYGSLNERRMRILDALRATGLNVVYKFDCYGTERDALIARSKVLLNIHFYESGIFEWIRVLYPLANKKPVVSEESLLTSFDKGIDGVVRFAPLTELVDVCREMVAHPSSRDAVISQIDPYLAARREEVVLTSVLQASSVLRRKAETRSMDLEHE